MNPAATLKPRYRVTQAKVDLSALQPVRVGTYLYGKRARNWEFSDPLEDRHMECGETHRIPHDRSVEAHDHDYYEIVLVRGGTALHRTLRADTPVSAGTALVVAPGQVHAFDDIDGLQNTNIYYLTEWLLPDLGALWRLDGVVALFLGSALFQRPVSDRIPAIPLLPGEMDACVRELHDIVHEYDRERPCVDYLKWCFQKLLLVLGRAHLRTNPDPPPLVAPPEVRAALEQLERYIEQGESIHVAALAQESGLSPDYFSKLFKEATGWSPMDYFQRRRIHHASWLLLNSPISITEVAQTLGYCDSSHFSHLFKRHQGVSPRQYRRMYSADE